MQPGSVHLPLVGVSRAPCFTFSAVAGGWVATCVLVPVSIKRLSSSGTSRGDAAKLLLAECGVPPPAPSGGDAAWLTCAGSVPINCGSSVDVVVAAAVVMGCEGVF